jgi:RNA polymerase sigma-70 factor (ECF subfamily)
MRESQTNAHLLERIAHGDAEAVREVIDRYGDLVWSLARRFTATDADAEEAVQDIFVTLWRKADRYDRSLGSEVTFVSVLARRLLIDRWRSASKRPDSEALLDTASAESTHTWIERDELVAASSEAFGQLPADHQLVLRLSLEFGLPHQAIAEVTGTPIGTVKTRIRTALGRIRDALKDHSATTGVRR